MSGSLLLQLAWRKIEENNNETLWTIISRCHLKVMHAETFVQGREELTHPWIVPVSDALGKLFPARDHPPSEILRHKYFDIIEGETVSRENA
jgi:hypothetical protein